MPARTEEAQGMTHPERRASQKGPLFAAQPILILDGVSVCENGVEGEEGDGVEIGVPGQGDVQAGTLDIWRFHGYRGPVKHQQGSIQDSDHSH